ncbi:endonuclease [Erythrobacter aquimaris]|uniref:Endonuclease n=1 Tax=Qipengyuania aquimaris TaxID=255984 RepID=A0A6I4TMV2_9SPHN|nr:S1/P1 nuclease [Qipengyuania aquimaris]MXO96520.1 endonuclease [Qipengyuania aquimaris]
MGYRAIRHGLLTALAALAALLPAQASAWGFYAHETTGKIAWENITPETRAKIDALFRAEPLLAAPGCRLRSIEDASTWPDCVRRTRWRWGYTAAWHYRTAPVCEDYNARRNCSGGNCVTAQIERSHRLLADESLPAHIRLEALAFLVHFIGDVHMPLHSGDHEDRGGNSVEAAYGIAPGLNLHWIWDGPLAERAITSAEVPLVRQYTVAERADLGGGDAAEWGRESWQISRDFVYPTAFDRPACEGADLEDETALTQEDIERAIPISQRRVQQAGVRIAEYLESAFAPGPLPEPEQD